MSHRLPGRDARQDTCVGTSLTQRAAPDKADLIILSPLLSPRNPTVGSKSFRREAFRKLLSRRYTHFCPLLPRPRNLPETSQVWSALLLPGQRRGTERRRCHATLFLVFCRPLWDARPVSSAVKPRCQFWGTLTSAGTGEEVARI